MTPIVITNSPLMTQHWLFEHIDFDVIDLNSMKWLKNFDKEHDAIKYCDDILDGIIQINIDDCISYFDITCSKYDVVSIRIEVKTIHEKFYSLNAPTSHTYHFNITNSNEAISTIRDDVSLNSKKYSAHVLSPANKDIRDSSFGCSNAPEVKSSSFEYNDDENIDEFQHELNTYYSNYENSDIDLIKFFNRAHIVRETHVIPHYITKPDELTKNRFFDLKIGNVVKFIYNDKIYQYTYDGKYWCSSNGINDIVNTTLTSEQLFEYSNSVILFDIKKFM